MTGRRLSIIIFVVAFWWYGVWCAFHHGLGLDPVQSWLGVVAVLVGLAWFMKNEIRKADDLPYTVVEEPVAPIEQGLDMEDKR